MSKIEMNSDIHEWLIDAGIEKLKNFGFTNVNRDNILVDEVYYYFLSRFINTLRGKSKAMDAEIEKLIGKGVKRGNK